MDGWLANSVVKLVTLHRTTEQAATRILADGVEFSASRISSFGQGFYTATWNDPPHGLVDVPVAVRTLNPLAGSLDEVSDVIDDLARLMSPRDPHITPEIAAEIRLRLLDLGYDGIVVRDGGGDGVDYVIGIAEGSVKVVIE